VKTIGIAAKITSDVAITPHPPLRGTFSPLRGAKELVFVILAPRERGEGGRRPGEGRTSR
ncbi:MAG TPA: hypothetical protein VER58_19160, partial [Thermoanaerobaculia bacterium]|nr:hypothetical protein [Thermoanaerobaculia bacterium]